ncbi:MAG: GNAT family N-acetyltransferase [Desulfobacterales bacterium]|nr:GNAT family N-acetyltransferase [Desulfobacterales bacterium]
MPKLYVDEYSKSLSGKPVVIACREGILRDHFADIIADIKFLNRYGVITQLFHNISNRFSNQKHFRELAKRLPHTKVIKILPENNFYQHVLANEDSVYKIIFLERKYLVDQEGLKINAITTQRIRQSISGYSDLIGNLNFKSVLEMICKKIDQGRIDRVHILPAGRHSIKHELFSIEGSGTLIANNFQEALVKITDSHEAKMVVGILNKYKREKYLKPRSHQYILENRSQFYVCKIDGIIVGCVEKREIDTKTVELGALAISTKFRSQRVGKFTVNAFIERMTRKGYTRFISLTNNPRLQKLYRRLGFTESKEPIFQVRQEESPGVAMFLKEV